MWYVIQVINGREDVMRERIERVVFNVFGDEDERVYREVLG